MGRKRDSQLGANRDTTAQAAPAAPAERGMFVHEFIAEQQSKLLANVAKRQAAVDCMACIGASDTVVEARRQRVQAVQQQAAATEQAEQDAAAEQQAAEQQAAAAERQQIVNDLVTVYLKGEEYKQYKYDEYTRVLLILAEVLVDASEISEYLMCLDARWPVTEKAKKLGMNKAAEQGYKYALAVKAFNVWRSTFVRGFTVYDSEALVSQFKTAEKLVKDDTYQEDHGLLKRAMVDAEYQTETEAAETLKKAIDVAQHRANEKEQAEQAEQMQLAAETTAEAARKANDLTTAKLAQLLAAVVQLSNNSLFEQAERSLLLAAADSLATRTQAAQQEAARIEERKERIEAGRDAETYEHLGQHEQEQVKYTVS